MKAYYNDVDPYCCKWLSNLMDAGLIAPGDVDSRPIQEVQPQDVAGYTQCHFFAGLGGWSYAARLAGWPDSRPMWTGSCPCQPFSGVGAGLGFSDPRHLFPEWLRLIREQRPSVIFGEQVATAAVWLDLVLSELEAEAYACGAFDLPAAGVGARHERQRLWFIADSDKARWEDLARISTAETKANFGAPAGMVHSQEVEHIRGAFEPDQNWIVNGVPGDVHILGALGNAIVPQVAAEVIKAYMEATHAA